MGRALIIGCGGVAGVVIRQVLPEQRRFEEIMIASRTKSKCDAIKGEAGRYDRNQDPHPPRWTRTTWTSCARSSTSTSPTS